MGPTKSDHNKWLITLTTITLSGFNCISDWNYWQPFRMGIITATNNKLLLTFLKKKQHLFTRSTAPILMYLNRKHLKQNFENEEHSNYNNNILIGKWNRRRQNGVSAIWFLLCRFKKIFFWKKSWMKKKIIKFVDELTKTKKS